MASELITPRGRRFREHGLILASYRGQFRRGGARPG